MAFTDGHPAATMNNVYYTAIAADSGGAQAYFRADGTVIKTLADGPLTPAEADTVFDRSTALPRTGDNAWVWDLAFDEWGNPVVAYATFPSRDHHQYHLARHDGGRWIDRVLLEDAGGSIADTTLSVPQHYYSGGIALDPTDPGIVYVSHENLAGGWDLEQWRASDGGAAWSVRAITRNAQDDNVRPVVPVGRRKMRGMVLWMSGRYDHFVSGTNRPAGYDTAILIWEEGDEPLAVPGWNVLAAAPELAPAWPNPTPGPAMLSFTLRDPVPVTLEVHDAAGRIVCTLLDAAPTASGAHEIAWDGTRGGRPVAPGPYFCTLRAGGRAARTRLVVLR
jgi:hypothetical protein